MAQKAIVCVKDGALGAFLPPFFVPSIGVAVRHFGDEVHNKESPMFAHPEDYELYHLGQFDDAGIFDIFPQPVRLARGLDYEER